MAIWQYGLRIIPKQALNEELRFDSEDEKYWEIIDLNSTEIVMSLDNLLQRSDWGDSFLMNWKGDIDKLQDHDASIIQNRKGFITDFRLRVDLRGNYKLMLQRILKICKEYELMLVDYAGNIIEPELDKIQNLIQESSAIKFLRDPRQYLKEIEER